MPNPTKGRCPICLNAKPIGLRKDGTLREHQNRAGTRVCGGTGQNPMPVQQPEPVNRRDLAVLDGLVVPNPTDPAATVTSKADQSHLRDRLVTALGEVRLNLGPNALAMIERGETIRLSGNEKDAVTDAALGVVRAELNAKDTEIRELRRADAEVRALHQQYRDVYAVGDQDSCAHCNQITGTVVPYPCPTITALDDVKESSPCP